MASGPIFYKGKPLFVDGKPAMDPACCCDGCCAFTGDEFISGFYAIAGDIEVTQNGSSTLEGTGCDAKFTVPVRVENVDTGEFYNGEATIESIWSEEHQACLWYVVVEDDALLGFTYFFPDFFIAGDGCSGEMDCNDAFGDCNGWDEGYFDIIDPDGPVNCQRPPGGVG